MDQIQGWRLYLSEIIRNMIFLDVPFSYEEREREREREIYIKKKKMREKKI